MEEIELAKKRKAEERHEREEKSTRENAIKRQKSSAKKVEMLQNGACSSEATIESANDVKLDDETNAELELKDEARSAKPSMMTVTKEIFVEEKYDKPVDDSNGGGVTGNEVTKQMDSDFNNDSDDEAVPEIFFGGPDPDDE